MLAICEELIGDLEARAELLLRKRRHSASSRAQLPFNKPRSRNRDWALRVGGRVKVAATSQDRVSAVQPDRLGTEIICGQAVGPNDHRRVRRRYER